MNKNQLKSAALGGIISNPVFVLVLGTCPTIAKSDTISNGLGLGLATAFVLICSNLFISLLRKVIPDKVHLPAYIVIIATFVTVVQLFVAKFLPDLNASIGSFIPLIVVNCIILGRAEAFACKNPPLLSLIDGASMGLGFTAALVIMGAIRQGLGAIGLTIFQQTAGGFIIFGILMATFNYAFALAAIAAVARYSAKEVRNDFLASNRRNNRGRDNRQYRPRTLDRYLPVLGRKPQTRLRGRYGSGGNVRTRACVDGKLSSLLLPAYPARNNLSSNDSVYSHYRCARSDSRYRA